MNKGNKPEKCQSENSEEEETIFGKLFDTFALSHKDASPEIDYAGNLLTKEDAAASIPDAILYHSLMHVRSQCNKEEKYQGHMKYREIFKGRIDEYLDKNKPLLHWENLKFEKAIRVGSFGIVWKAKWGGKRDVAVKVVNYHGLPMLYLERDIMVQLRHERIVQLLGTFRANVTYFVTPIYKGDLMDFKKISDLNILRYTIQLLQAVEWIHKHNVIHCDIKPRNCLVTDENNLVLTDFGSALYLDPAHYHRQYAHRKRRYGFPAYSDYQANKNMYYSKANDVFSVGCVLFELQTGQGFLWSRVNTNDGRSCYEMKKSFEEGRKLDERTKLLAPPEKFINNRVPLKDTLPAAAPYDKFLKKILLSETSDRPSASELLIDENLLNLMNENNCSVDNLDTSGVADELKSVPDIAADLPDEVQEFYTDDTYSLGMFYLDPAMAGEYNESRSRRQKPTETAARGIASTTNSPIAVPLAPLMKDSINEKDNSTVGIENKSGCQEITENLIIYLKSLPLWTKLEKELHDGDPIAHIKTRAQIVLKLEKAMQVEENMDSANASEILNSNTEIMAIKNFPQGGKLNLQDEQSMFVSPAVSASSSKDSAGSNVQAENLQKRAAEQSSVRPGDAKRPKVQAATREEDVGVSQTLIKEKSNKSHTEDQVSEGQRQAELGVAAEGTRKDIEKQQKRTREEERSNTDCTFCKAKFQTWSELYEHIREECDLDSFI